MAQQFQPHRLGAIGERDVRAAAFVVEKFRRRRAAPSSGMRVQLGQRTMQDAALKQHIQPIARRGGTRPQPQRLGREKLKRALQKTFDGGRRRACYVFPPGGRAARSRGSTIA